MDPAITELLAIGGTAISALFSALLISMRQSRQDWKDLYFAERTDHKETLKSSSSENHENSVAIRELADFIHELPRRRDDWARTSERPR